VLALAAKRTKERFLAGGAFFFGHVVILQYA
jgi:hypothetical protein